VSLDPASVPAKWQLNLEQFKPGVRVRQTTDHATEKWVAIGRTACTSDFIE